MAQLDQRSVSSVEHVLDYYNTRPWLRVLCHVAFMGVVTYQHYHAFDRAGILNYSYYTYLHLANNIASLYFVFYWLIPHFLFQKRYGWFLLWFLLWYFIPFSFTCVKYNEEIEILNKYQDMTGGFNMVWVNLYRKYGLLAHFTSWNFVVNVLMEFLSAFIPFTVLKGTKMYFDAKMHEFKLLRINYELEAKYLQHQLNPHFLFNSLNNIYGLILQNNPGTVSTITQLQALLAATLNDATTATVPLTTEIEYLKNYMALEQIRHGNHAQIHHNFDMLLPSSLQIAPRLLLPFVENTFKHSLNVGIEKVYADVRLQIKGQNLTFEVKNNKPILKSTINQTGGIGLPNVKRRLNLLYPSHTLTIQETPNDYTVLLQLEL